MKPPHWLCTNCGSIITDSGNEPGECIHCNFHSWKCVGYQGQYDLEEVRSLFCPSEDVLNQKLKMLK